MVKNGNSFVCDKWCLALLSKKTMTLPSQRLAEYLEKYFFPSACMSSTAAEHHLGIL